MAFRYFPAVLLSLSCCTEGPVFLGIVRVNLSRPSLFLPAFLIDSAQSAPLLFFSVTTFLATLVQGPTDLHSAQCPALGQ